LAGPPAAAGFIRYDPLGAEPASRLLFSQPMGAKRSTGTIFLSLDNGAPFQGANRDDGVRRMGP